MPATVFQRVLGYVIDVLTVGVIVSLVRFFINDTPIWDAPAIGALSFYAYKVAMETLWGTTIGKLGLHVTAEKYPKFLTALIRNSWLLFPGLVMLLHEGIGQLLGTVLILAHIVTLMRSRDFRSVFDVWAGARVIDGKK